MDKEFWLMVLIAVGFLALLIGSYFLNGSRTEECIDRAEFLGLPCLHGTVTWDEDECECMSSTHGGLELEFPLPGWHGCMWED